MLLNYLKIAIKVLGRNKFFTFISLFGICFTLAILMLIVSYLQTELGNNAPFKNRSKITMINSVSMKQMVTDTTMVIDSALVNNLMTYDTSYTYDDRSRSTTSSSGSLKLFQEHFQNMESISNYSYNTSGETFNEYRNGAKIVLDVCSTDERFWQIFNFKFLEGSPYDAALFEQGAQVAVIHDDLAQQYFGKRSGLIGEEINMDGKDYEVIGVIKNPHHSNLDANIYVPTSTSKGYPWSDASYVGGFTGIFLKKNSKTNKDVHEEIQFITSQISMDAVERYNKIEIFAKTPNENFAQNMIYHEEASKSWRQFLMILVGFISLFIILPTLNLVNLNVSRILERSSEIGVRKAFGAHKSNIVFQFVFENVVLTILGGILGFIVAMVLIYLINDAGVLANIKLKMNVQFFAYGFLIILLFGIVSGFLPAYRMSRVHIVNALKENKL